MNVNHMEFIDDISLLITNQDGEKNPLYIDQGSNSFDNFFNDYKDNNRYEYYVQPVLVNFPTKLAYLKESNTKQRLIFVCVNGIKTHEIIINEKVKRNIIAYINLLEITNWKSIKEQDNVTTVSLTPISNFENEKNQHFSFPFIINSFKDLEKFSLEFRDIEDNLISFSGENKAYPLIQLFVGIKEKVKRHKKQ